jgi:hypothetical protein
MWLGRGRCGLDHVPTLQVLDHFHHFILAQLAINGKGQVHNGTRLHLKR